MSTPRRVGIGICILATALPLLAISQQSLWMDEAMTGNVAVQQTLRLFWQKLASGKGSDIQMPLYMFYAWVWARLFGASEISLRLANYPWFLVGQVAGTLIWADRRKGFLFVSIAACSSFIWFYLNEARPYIMQYGAACVVVWFLSSLTRGDSVSTWKYWLFGIGIIVLAGSSMLGLLWVGTSLLVVGFLVLKKGLRPPLLPILFCALALLVLCGYYFWTLSAGAGGTRGHQTMLNVLYVAYELCGFTGLGPGRLDIREHGMSSLRSYLLPTGAFALVLFFIFLRLWKRAGRTADKNALVTTAIYALPPVLFLLIVGAFIHFSVLGRHMMPAAPFVFMFLTAGIYALIADETVSGRILTTSFFLLSIVSCFGVRFLPWHMKDDYRGAVTAVSRLLAHDQLAWWCASKEGAEYYRLPVDGPPDRDGRVFVYVRNPKAEELRRFPMPAVVILSKRDLYDANGTVMAMLREREFTLRQTLPAFSIWEKRR
jgi:hypothetical protein